MDILYLIRSRRETLGSGVALHPADGLPRPAAEAGPRIRGRASPSGGNIDAGLAIPFALARADGPLAPLANVVLGLHLDETDFIHKPTAARYGMLLVIDLLATEPALRNVDASQELLRRVKLAPDEYRQDGDRLPLGTEA